MILPILFALQVAGLPAGGPAGWVRALPPASVQVFPDRHEIVIEIAPVDVPMPPMDMAAMGHAGGHGPHEAHAPVYPPVMGVDLPLSGLISGFRIELVDARGRNVPDALLHHYNLIDPNHRELFLPISRRMVAAGSETGEKQFPKWIVGMPFTQGERLIASAMLHNPTMEDYAGVRTRLILTYTDTDHWYPLLRVLPWQLDVMFPVGDKAFDLPAGRSEKFYEGSPAIPGKIVAIGGHGHDFMETLTLTDVTTGEVIWQAEPDTDATGRVVGMPIKKFYGITGIGVEIVPEHRYRVTVTYDNTTGAVLPQGGMGVVAGLFQPDRQATWPAVNMTDALYIKDLRHALRLGDASPVSVAAPAHQHSGSGVEHTHD